MDVPLTEIEIEYLIHAAEKISRQKKIPAEFSQILFYWAQEKLNKIKEQGITHEDLEKQAQVVTYYADLGARIEKRLRMKKARIEYYTEDDKELLKDFYLKYEKNNKIDELSKKEAEHEKWGTLGANFQELEDRSAIRKDILATYKAMRTALKILKNGIPEKLLQDTEYDEHEEGSNDTYNIIPFDGRTDLPEVQKAIASLKWDIDAESSPTRGRDVLDCLQKVFGFQESSVSNQRENIVNLLSNEQMRLCTPGQHKTAFEDALENVFSKTLDNYTKWCSYLSIKPIWKNTDENATGEDENATSKEKDENVISKDENVISKEKKILYISLYYLIWGEAANVRFLPECLCYIFHRMSEQLDTHLRRNSASLTKQVPQPVYEGSFIDQVIQPLYEVIAAEANIKKEKDVPHSKWRNYDDFNEYFWSPRCTEELSWPLNPRSTFFRRPEGLTTAYGKTSFIERRTFLHLYHSFHRMWIFHVIMFQALAIIAFNDEKLNSETLRQILIVGPTYFSMKLIQSGLDIWLKDGAYSNTNRADVLRIRRCIIRFRALCLLSTLIIFLVGIVRKCLQEKISSVEESIAFYACIVVLVIYACTITWINQLEKWVVRRMDERLLDSYLKEEYVGRDMGEKKMDIFWYTIFWLVTLGINLGYTYCYLIRPLVRTTRDITDVSKNIHNMLAIGSLWAGVICAYFVAPHIVYNGTSAVAGYIVGRWDGLGQIKFFGDVHKRFNEIPTAFMDHLRIKKSRPENNQEDVKKLDAAKFSPFWNKIVMHLREEDYISYSEQIALCMPEKSGYIDVIQWPLFLLVGKVSLAIKIAAKPISQEDMWVEISRDVYMKYAVEECFHSVKFILCSFLDNEGKLWVHRIYEGIKKSIADDGYLGSEFQLNQLESFVNKINELMGLLELEYVDYTEVKEPLKSVIQHDFLGENAAGEQISISDFDWHTDPELKSQIERLHRLLTMKPADHVPRNREARRRLEFFTNSLFMSMPTAKPVREMLSFSVLTPYYSETVLYSSDELFSRNVHGVTLIDYLKNLYPDEWANYCERKDRKRYTGERELRLWASYRGQTLARTVRGTMYYQKALLLQAYREMLIKEGLGVDGLPSTPVPDVSMDEGSQILNECFDIAKAHVDLKFTYVVSCQIYGKQKIKDKKRAADIAFLLKRNEGLRVAYVDEVKNEFYSKLVKADKNGEEMEVYSIKLPGNPILGEGKPENQNHAIVFTRGNAIQTIDMNQENYFEETLKMRNLLEEFHREPAPTIHRKRVIRPPTILGIREHIFTGSASSLASFMSNQETGFVTLGQRVIANPLKVRMHYGHPDVFDRVFHITRGGISKASRGINISEDIYAGFNSTLRQGSVTHHEYIQVGKGRDVGFNQIATFEGKVAGGNGEQVLSRDIYRLGQRFDFFRMLSFYYTTVGYYFSSMLMVITLYILLYGNLIMALSGTRVPHVLNDTDMAPEWFLMIVLLPAIYLLLVPYLEQGLEKAVESFLAMFFSLGSIFSAFSLGTRIHWFGRTVIHGGASYQATGRGFVLHHIKFSENYRLYSRSHFVKGMEVLFLVAVYIIYGFHSVRAFYNNLLLLGGSILSISWIVAPFLFDSSPFDPNKNTEDWKNWNDWCYCKNGPDEKRVAEREGVPIEEKSWEAWWDKELSHIRTTEGRVIETILSLRFFIFPFVVGYKLDAQGLKNSLSNCVIHWIYVVVILLIYEFICEKKTMNQLVSKNRMAAIGALVSVHYYSAFGDIIAIMTTVWGFISFFSNNRLATIGALAIAGYCSVLGDTLAFLIAIITTVWGFLSMCVAWKPTLERFNLWELVMYFAWMCDTGIGALLFNIDYIFSQESIKRFQQRRIHYRNVSEYLKETAAVRRRDRGS